MSNSSPTTHLKSLDTIFKDFNGNDRTGVYVDAANLYYSCGDIDLKIDYKDLTEIFSRYMAIRSLNYFVAVAPPNIVDESFTRTHKFTTFLENTGWRVHRKVATVQENDDGGFKIVKGNVDVDLASSMIDDAHCSAGSIDRIILFSGDKDYAPAVKILQRYTRVIVVSSAAQLSRELKLVADDVIYLEELKPYIDYRRYNSTPVLHKEHVV